MSEIFPGQHEANRRMDEFLDSIGKGGMPAAELIVARERMGLSQSQLGAVLGLSKRAIQRWEDGERAMTSEHYDRIVRLEAEFDAQVNRSIRAMKRLTAGERVLIVYRSDKDLLAEHPSAPYPASWGRAVAGMVRAEVGDVEIVFAPSA